MQGEASTRLGFTDYFRVELAWANLLGLVLLLAPVPVRLKEWAYAAFAITLGSALIALAYRINGANTGWKAELWILPTPGIGIAILTNAGDGRVP